MTQVSLEPNDQNHIDLVLQPIKTDTLITEAHIHEAISSSEYSHLYVQTSNVKNAIAELNNALKPLQANQSAKEIRYQVLERRDATISISIDKDEMSAFAEISTALGGKHLSAKAILNAAQKAGVARGFSKEELIKLAQKAAKEPSGSVVKGEIALGKNPINGKDAQIKPLVESAQSRILKPKKLDNGRVDMRDLGEIICVKVGDPLAKKVPLTEGKKGFKVTGIPLDPTPGEDIQLMSGDGTIISPKNDNVLESTLVGLPRIIDNGMEVDEIYKIGNVDVNSGHINFEGSVIIDGDVCEGMRVSAKGDITIGGFVESATLDAGGDITIQGGIIGRKQEVEGSKISDIKMSTTINAKGSVYAKYCQYTEINCNNLRIENQLMHSIIRVRDKLWVGLEEKANGKLIAGYISAGSSVHAGIVGATAGSSTFIIFETKIKIIQEQLSDVEQRLQVESDKMDELKNLSNKLKKLPKEKAKPEMLTKVISSYKHHANKMGKVLLEKEAVEQQLQDYMSGVYVEATEKLYHSVNLTVGDYHDRSKREYGPSRMRYNERKIHIEALVNTAC